MPADPAGTGPGQQPAPLGLKGSYPVQQSPRPGQPQRPMAASGQTVALHEQDISHGDMPPGPPKQESQVNFAPKKQAVYPQPGIEANYPAAGARPMLPPGHSGMSLLTITTYLIAMSIPVAGLVLAIVWGMNPTPPDKSNLAKAMIVLNGLWSIIFIIFIYYVYSIISQVADISIKFGF